MEDINDTTKEAIKLGIRFIAFWGGDVIDWMREEAKRDPDFALDLPETVKELGYL